MTELQISKDLNELFNQASPLELKDSINLLMRRYAELKGVSVNWSDLDPQDSNAFGYLEHLDKFFTKFIS